MNPKWHLSYASGYIELGLFEEAEAELAHVPHDHREKSEFLQVRANLFQEQKRWPELAVIAEQLCTRHSQNVGGWIMWAYATRRFLSLKQAEQILLQAEKLHASEATIQFNLGCYACQQGNLEEAKRRVDRAIEIDPQFRELAAQDPDLIALRLA